MKRLFILIICFLFLFGCGPKEFKPWSPPEIKYNMTEYYDIKKELEQIPKPTKIQPLWVNLDNEKIEFVDNPDNAEFVLLAPQEYGKIAVLVKLAGTYKKIILSQENLINIYIDEINALKEQVSIERETSIRYRKLWVETENFRLQQIHDLKKQSFYKDVVILLEGVGMISILILSL